MEAIGLLVNLEARPGKEADVETLLKSAQPLALDEKRDLEWYAMKLGAANPLDGRSRSLTRAAPAEQRATGCHQICPMPPSTLISSPVMYEASDDARKATTLATSSGFPIRFMGTASTS